MNREEEILQAKCHQWLWNNYPNKRGLFFSVKNNSRNKIEGSIDKAKGMVSGVSDYIIIFDTQTAFIEFKTLKGYQSINQKKFASQIANTDHCQYYIIRDFETFKELVESNWNDFK